MNIATTESELSNTDLMYKLECGSNDVTKYLWKSRGNILLHKRTNTSACIVDKDRFIAIFGGDCLGRSMKQMELVALNCDVSIPLCGMNRSMKNGYSKYNEKFHGIVTCGNGKRDVMEIYDIDKDKWRIIKNKLLYRVDGMMIDNGNPNIVYI